MRVCLCVLCVCVCVYECVGRLMNTGAVLNGQKTFVELMLLVHTYMGAGSDFLVIKFIYWGKKKQFSFRSFAYGDCEV